MLFVRPEWRDPLADIYSTITINRLEETLAGFLVAVGWSGGPLWRINSPQQKTAAQFFGRLWD